MPLYYCSHRFPHSPRERTPPEVREAREQEKELQRLDRDTRTVFAYNLSLKADERDLFDFFSEAGSVVDIRIICDRHTKRSKGFAYIEYEDRVRADYGCTCCMIITHPLHTHIHCIQTSISYPHRPNPKQNDIIKAIGLSGKQCLGQTVMVKMSEV